MPWTSTNTDERSLANHGIASPPTGTTSEHFLAESTGGVRDRLVERLDPQPDQTVLDIAAGTGETSFAVAERLGERRAR